MAELFPAFLDASRDPDLAEPFRLPLHWYQKSNMRAGGMASAIILGVMLYKDVLGGVCGTTFGTGWAWAASPRKVVKIGQ